MKQTILFVINVDWFFLSHRLPIALEAQRQGYRVHVATALTGKLEELQRRGLIVHPLIEMDRGSTGLMSACRTAFELWKVFRLVRPDIVHLVTIKPVLFGGLVARLVGVPSVVIAVSGLGFVFIASGVKALVRRWVVGLLYAAVLGHRNLKVIFQNPDDRASLTRLPNSKIEMIRGSGVDLTQYQHVPLLPGVPLVLMAARLLADKGVREFVQAARLLRHKGVSARFCLVGNVDPANPASISDSELALWAEEGVVELWGFRADIATVLASAYLIVLPSYREGLPKVLLEAAASGRAVVTTDVPGCRDAIQPGVTGVLVQVRNAVALANAIGELIDNPLRCKAMGDAGRVLAECAFDIRKVIATHMRIYRELVESA